MGCGGSAAKPPVVVIEGLDRKSKLISVFDACDFDGSGAIVMREYRKMAGGDGPASIMEGVFKQVDTNSDGAVSKKEFVRYHLRNSATMNDTDFVEQVDRWLEACSKQSSVSTRPAGGGAPKVKEAEEKPTEEQKVQPAAKPAEEPAAAAAESLTEDECLQGFLKDLEKVGEQGARAALASGDYKDNRAVLDAMTAEEAMEAFKHQSLAVWATMADDVDKQNEMLESISSEVDVKQAELKEANVEDLVPAATEEAAPAATEVAATEETPAAEAAAPEEVTDVEAAPAAEEAAPAATEVAATEETPAAEAAAPEEVTDVEAAPAAEEAAPAAPTPAEGAPGPSTTDEATAEPAEAAS